jgi:hypothetical protein
MSEELECVDFGPKEAWYFLNIFVPFICSFFAALRSFVLV